MGFRWYGLPRDYCVLLGLLTLCIHDPYNVGFGIRSSTFKGLYTQHFGLFFLPLFVGSFAQMLQSAKKSTLNTAILFSLTAMSHLWVGLYAAIIALSLSISQFPSTKNHYQKLLAFSFFVFILLAWWILPLLITNDYAGGLPWLRSFQNGWVWYNIFGNFFTGEIFDHSRLPVLTVLCTIGCFIHVFSFRNPFVRHWLILTLFTGILFLGRTNLGALYNFIPMHSQVNVMRYITGIHICGLFTITTALWFFIQIIMMCNQKIGSCIALFLSTFVLVFGSLDIKSTTKLFDAKNPSYSSLIHYLRQLPDHRFIVHKNLGTGNHFHRDLLPLYTNKGQVQSYAHGFHCTLSTYYAEYFDFSQTASDLFHVGSIVTKGEIPDSFPVNSYQSVWKNEEYTVFHPYRNHHSDLFSIIDVKGAITGPDFRKIRPAVRTLSVPTFGFGVLPLIKREPLEKEIYVLGADGTARSWKKENAKELIQSIVGETSQSKEFILENFHRDLSSYSIDVQLPSSKKTWLLLKVNMFPFWKAYVNHKEVTIHHVAPNFMAVQLSSEKNKVRFTYKNPMLQKFGFLLSIFLMIIGAGTSMFVCDRNVQSFFHRRFFL